MSWHSWYACIYATNIRRRLDSWASSTGLPTESDGTLANSLTERFHIGLLYIALTLRVQCFIYCFVVDSYFSWLEEEEGSASCLVCNPIQGLCVCVVLARSLALLFPLSFHGIRANRSRSISAAEEKQVLPKTQILTQSQLYLPNSVALIKSRYFSTWVCIKKAKFACLDSKIAILKFLTRRHDSVKSATLHSHTEIGSPLPW